MGIIADSTHKDYIDTCDALVKFFGRSQAVDDLQVEDFAKLKRELGKTLGLRSLGNEINRIRIVFEYACDEELIDRPLRFGKQFTRPAKRVLRREKQKKGPMMLEAHEVHQLIRHATPLLRAMIYLAINCGLGNNDCASLSWASFDLDFEGIALPWP